MLDTCDRFELYCSAAESTAETGASASAPDFERLMLGAEVRNSQHHWAQKTGPAALQHLYRVVSGLESPLFGEKAIQGQVKQAYQEAAASKTLAKELHLGFQSALRTGKRVRCETLLDSGAMSHVGATWQILQQSLQQDVQHGWPQNPSEWAICFIGANQLNDDLAKLLRKKELTKFSKFFLGSRSFAKAQQASRDWGGQAFRLDQMAQVIPHCQVLISATRAPHYVLFPEHIGERQAPLYIFDLAMPRDVDPRLGELSGVRLWNIVDIEAQIQMNGQQRRAKELWAQQIIDEELEKFYEHNE